MNKKELWLRLKSYHFDDLVPASLWDHIQGKFGGTNASTKAFANKLARKLGWSYAFSLRAIHEYKKFVYLGVTSDFVVTPSQVIDQVWHQHLLFSKAYRKFCQEVIEYNFDHSPELVFADDQTGVYNAQYLDTLELYEKEFGMGLPSDIWGEPKFVERGKTAYSYRSRKKTTVIADGDGRSGTYYSDTPLCDFFDTSNGESFAEFGGFEGGDSGGGGAGGSWGDGDSSSDSSGSDSGSCSSCSSGCGGGD